MLRFTQTMTKSPLVLHWPTLAGAISPIFLGVRPVCEGLEEAVRRTQSALRGEASYTPPKLNVLRPSAIPHKAQRKAAGHAAKQQPRGEAKGGGNSKRGGNMPGGGGGGWGMGSGKPMPKGGAWGFGGGTGGSPKKGEGMLDWMEAPNEEPVRRRWRGSGGGGFDWAAADKIDSKTTPKTW